MKNWQALFTQTGSEIVGISKALGYFPDMIITNREDLTNVHPDLPRDRIVQLNKKPTVAEYRSILDRDAIITLNGFLRIIPGEICEEFEVYNGHPGLITRFPILKGKDPQAKAVALGLQTSGCILHRARAEVDSGEIIKEVEVSIAGLNTEEVISLLRNEAIKLWVTFLQAKLQ